MLIDIGQHNRLQSRIANTWPEFAGPARCEIMRTVLWGLSLKQPGRIFGASLLRPAGWGIIFECALASTPPPPSTGVMFGQVAGFQRLASYAQAGHHKSRLIGSSGLLRIGKDWVAETASTSGGSSTALEKGRRNGSEHRWNWPHGARSWTNRRSNFEPRALASEPQIMGPRQRQHFQYDLSVCVRPTYVPLV